MPTWGLLALLVAAPWGPATANAQDRGIGRGAAKRTDSMAIAPVEIDASVEASAVADGRAESLARFRSALAASLSSDLAGMRKFTIVAREDLDPVLGEQALAGSGIVDAADPATARAMKVAGVRWLAVPRIVSFEDISRTRRFDGVERTVVRRTVRALVRLQLLDSTTGVIGETGIATMEATETADENDRARPAGGDPTNSVLERVAREVASALSCRLLEASYPSRVLAVNGSSITVDRGDGACLAVGDSRIVASRGRIIRDPDTGEVLGRDEADTGLMEITRVESRLARGRLIKGTARVGSVLRTLPAGGTVTLVRPLEDDFDGETGDGSTASAPDGLSGLGRVALVVRNQVGLDASIVDGFRSLATGAVAATGVEVIDAGVAWPEGLGDPEGASALSLSEAVGADRMLVVDLASADESDSRVSTPNGGDAALMRLEIVGAWSLAEVASGAAVAGGIFDGSSAQLIAGDGEWTIDVRRRLAPEAMRAAADRLADDLSDALRNVGAPTSDRADVGYVLVDATLDGLVVPEIERGDDGRWFVRSTSLPVVPGGVEVELDGLVVGTTPSLVDARKGPHGLRLTRQGIETWGRAIRVTGASRDEPQVIRVGLRLDEAARTRYLENAKVVQDLEVGAALTAAQVAAIEGFARFLEQSGYRIDRRESRNLDIESDEVPEVLQWNSFWNRW